MFQAQALQLPTGQPIDLDIKAGEIHCLSGDSGVGKTRLLRALADLDPCEGRISLNGHNRSDATGPDWRRQVMLVPARPRWWLPTAAEHMARPINGLLPRVHLHADRLNCPAEQLSTGESIRLALLRALSREPEVLLLDEPTAALDEDSEQAIEALLKEYVRTQPRCILWVTHSKAQARRVADYSWHLGATEMSAQP